MRQPIRHHRRHHKTAAYTYYEVEEPPNLRLRALNLDEEETQPFGNDGGKVANSLSHLKATPIRTINEEREGDEDELSRVEKLLSKGALSFPLKKEEWKVRWVVGEWTECLDAECFNWNTGKDIVQIMAEIHA